VKTAISLPDDLFQRAEATARRLRVSRSQLYSTAITEYLERRRSEGITQRLDEVYSDRAAELEPALLRAQLESLDGSSW
jgi:metal-responsive CopG/Arc/MetJ family transcriptional regulator